MGKSHKALLKEALALQAENYPSSTKLRHPETVAPMLELALPTPEDRVLDIACGAGFVALGFAPFVKSVVGIDISPEMVEAARRTAAERGCANVEFLSGDGEDLKFGTAAFDIVACRFTFHHFENPEKALFEMKRVLTPGGRIILYDTISSRDDRKAELHNLIEKARDPSHVRMLQVKEYEVLFRKTGLMARSKIVVLMKREFEEWMNIVGADARRRKRVRAALTSAESGDMAGIGIRLRDGRINFTHTHVIWLLLPRQA